MKKKILAILLSSMTVISTAVTAVSPAMAQEASISSEYTSGDFQIKEEDGVWSVVKYLGDPKAKEVTLPDNYNGNKITKVGDELFKYNHYLTKVTIPGSYKEIGHDCFFDCQQLTTAILSDGLETIGKNAFMGSHLASITIPDSVTTLGNSAFENCKDLKEVTIPANVTSIGDYCFTICGNLEKVTFASNDNLKTLGGQSFAQCKSLKSIKIPTSVTELGYGSFAHCEALETADITSKITEIDVCMFEDCTSLKSVYIPASVKKIGSSVFGGDTALTDIYFAGSKGKWKKIDKDKVNNEPLEKATIHYNASGAEESVNYSISYNSVITFGGKKVTAEDFGDITISCNNTTYKAVKIRANKKLNKFQITAISPKNAKLLKALRNGTKKASGLPYTVVPYTVSNNSPVTVKMGKDNSLKRVSIKLKNKNYKCAKTDYDWSAETKVITFKGTNFKGSYTVSGN